MFRPWGIAWQTSDQRNILMLTAAVCIQGDSRSAPQFEQYFQGGIHNEHQ